MGSAGGPDSRIPDVGWWNLVHFADLLAKSEWSGVVWIGSGPENCILCREDVNGLGLHKRALHLIGILELL